MIEKVCICGAGTMGLGIAQVAAAAGLPTVVYDLAEATIGQAQSRLQATLDKLVDKGKMDAAAAAQMMDRLRFTTELNECRADLLLEAIVENLEVKVSLFQKLEAINTQQAILVSNTSSLSVSEIGSQLQHPERFAGLHFFNPAPLMKLVEVVKATETAKAVVDELVSFTRRLGKVPVVCRDSPGFIVNRVARPFYIESLRLLEDGLATEKEIDDLLESRGFRMGPFRLMDLIGNDVNFAVSCSVYEQLHKPERLRPSEIQRDKVASGKLGKKSGEGYYKY